MDLVRSDCCRGSRSGGHLRSSAGPDCSGRSRTIAADHRTVLRRARRNTVRWIWSDLIAVEALGREDTFDPQQDPIVRVEAGRLRRTIEQYCAGPGVILFDGFGPI